MLMDIKVFKLNHYIIKACRLYVKLQFERPQLRVSPLKISMQAFNKQKGLNLVTAFEMK